ncbi:hypothetical protein [Heliophilum fasciatum]|uniref:hypothetical protein n=1 Tax=Heliophilum fasciatum TaxID=35700 RepID=UPI00104D512B|nr:hypothetical protein [Heliophilum fasciatum]MCW2279323.1 hypothetical protein [Heliophilum fasciatum]
MHVPLIDVNDQTMDVVLALEDDSLLHLEFASSEPTMADQIRYGHYDLELFAQQQKLIRRIVIFAAGIRKTPEPLNIGSLTTHQSVIHLSRHFDGADELERALSKIRCHEPLEAQDKLRIMLLPMMFEKLQERSQAAWKITEVLHQENPDNSAYLIGTMVAANFSNLLSPEKEKILEVLRIAYAFQELYREFEEKGARSLTLPVHFIQYILNPFIKNICISRNKSREPSNPAEDLKGSLFFRTVLRFVDHHGIDYNVFM